MAGEVVANPEIDAIVKANGSPSPITSFNVTADNTYAIPFNAGYDLTIVNNTNGDLYVSPDNNFELDSHGIGNFLIIPLYTVVSNFDCAMIQKNYLYFYSNGEGTISVIKN